MLHCGDTFLLPKSTNSREHLWIVITDPEPETGKAVCVNLTSRNQLSETTVVLQKGEHPFVTHESVVYYVDSQIFDLSLVEKMIEISPTRFTCVKHEPCSKEVLQRIQEGLLASKLASKKIKQYCRQRWSENGG